MSNSVFAPAFTLANPHHHALLSAPVWVGIPCPPGVFFMQPGVSVSSAEGIIHSLAVQPQLLWPDGSMQWVLVVGTCSLQAGQQLDCQLQPALPQQLTGTQRAVEETATHLRVMNGQHSLWQLTRAQLLAWSADDNAGLSLSIKAEQHVLSVDNCRTTYRPISNANGVVAIEVTQHADVVVPNNKCLLLQACSRVFLESGDLWVQVTVTNPTPAHHPNGQWDLGDKNSIAIDSIALTWRGGQPQLLLEEQQFTPGQHTLTLYQASSGGAQWQSPVHQDAKQTVNLPFSGYQLTAHEQVIMQGPQAKPRVRLSLSTGQMELVPSQFWQHFPAQLELCNDTVSLSLLGASRAPAQELQPGEQKTRSSYLRVHATQFPSSTPNIRLHPAWVQASRVMPFFEPSQFASQLHQLVQQGIKGDNSFFAKRERIDEYGWRHFGELYADHEAAQTPETPLFVSHYNNQYDPIQGMLTQWLLSGNTQWFTLADDLAKHVADIDVYHTEDDKPDYSGGLFWHTDHYVQAHTATHRTYSKHQPQGVYEGHDGGGGPGGQHCYTTGLLWHYLLTGHAPSKTALLRIADWITRYYEGDGTVLAVLMGLKNRHNPGLKNILTGKYPLDRGTGNYLHTLMDRYALLQQQRDLDHCAHIIYNCIAPDEDLSQRNFDNIEATWFYTVLLQAVCRFILLKEQQQQNDAAYAYAVESLCHYAEWMSRHEQNALEHAERLEFPNQTWTAQDLRKVCILYFASRYLPTADAQAALNRADLLLSRCEAWLSASEESSNTRVLCLMMQNAHHLGYRRAPQPMSIKREYPAHESLTRPSLTSAVWQAIRSFSWRRELRQFKRRFAR